MKNKVVIGVVGGSHISEKQYDIAYEVGKHIALNNCLLICGGLSGTMEASAKGAREHGGCVLGILPDDIKADANPYISVAIPTGMGVGRNVLIVRTADVLIALPGSYGTLNEMALALNIGKPIIALPGSWRLTKMGDIDMSLFKEAIDPCSAVGLALSTANNIDND